jgi:hypothetical protein
VYDFKVKDFKPGDERAKALLQETVTYPKGMPVQ